MVRRRAAGDAPPGRARGVRRDGRLRPPVRRHRGTAHRGRGPAANGAGVHAMWRFVEDSSGMLHSSVRRQRAFIRLWWAVQGAVTVGSVLSLVVSAVLVANGADHARHGVPAVPVRAADVAPAGGPRPPAGDRAEGQRGDGPRHRPARGRADDRRRRHDRRRRPARWPSSCRGVSFDYDGRRPTTILHRRRHRRRHAPDGRSASSAAPAAARRRSPACCCASSRRPAARSRSAACRSPTSRWPSCAARRPRAPGGRAVRGHDPRQRHAVRPGAVRRRRRARRCAGPVSARSSRPASTARSGRRRRAVGR